MCQAELTAMLQRPPRSDGQPALYGPISTLTLFSSSTTTLDLLSNAFLSSFSSASFLPGCLSAGLWI